jgi:predicted nucleotidyltransferase component of viral defense system
MEPPGQRGDPQVIGRAAIVERVREWGLREDVVEKDYALGWVLWGIGSDPVLANGWVFKGGTCLKKCYVETYRFSEDLDFTVLPGGPADDAAVVEALQRMLARVQESSGIDFALRPPVVRSRPAGTSIEGRIYFRGPRGVPEAASIKIDLSTAEVVARPPVLRPISHPYPDTLPGPATVRSYSFEEVFAEKLRAMGERGRPRDLYDIVNLYWRADFRQHAELVRSTLDEKCRTKGVPVPTIALLTAARTRAELETEWLNMLGHQLPALPPFEQFWGELPGLFDWLEGRSQPAELPAIAMEADEEPGWTPPPTVWTWGAGVSLETVRFAAANRLCIELGYQRRTRVIEPYSLRRSRAGHVLLHAVKADTREHRSYRVDRMESVRVTTRPFRPVYAVEFASMGPMSAPPTTRRPATRRTATRRSTRSRPRRSTGTVYILECPVCGRQFRRTTRTTALNRHNNEYGERCYGRRGSIVDTDYE